MEIALLVGAAVLLFGAKRVPELARGLGQAKKEFMVGQAEAEVAAERTRAEARAQAEANLASPPVTASVTPPPAVPTEPSAPHG